MEQIRLFIDFGSTYTKVCALDMEREEIAGWAKAPSTVESDITRGLSEALDRLRRQVPFTQRDVRAALACSSAAGGLRVACIGLTPELTTKAALLSACGAGARVVGTWSRYLTEEDIRRLEELRPDIVLLAGGTDGGDKRAVTHNASLLAAAGDGIGNVIAAGNKSARDEIESLFAGTDKNVVFAPNIMPALGELDTGPVNERIRAVFLSRITAAKGVEKAESLIGRVLMPTPSAVLDAAVLLADGAGPEPGLGELMLVDVGGATTDVISVAEGAPASRGTGLAGLREPRVKRTVEGDLGLYHNLDSLSEAAGAEPRRYESLHSHRSIPESERERLDHVALTSLAVRLASRRHCGVLETLYTGSGPVKQQRGKDLSSLPVLIGAGGPLAFSPDCRTALSAALKGPQDGDRLMPRSPGMYRDARYIFYACGLLSRSDPPKALRFLKKYLEPV